MKRISFERLGLLGSSPAMKTLQEQVVLAAPHWDTVLLFGERGTGKELLARAIHRLGPTRGSAPILVDCAAIHPSTAESELFGHERGAFTGAVHKRIGLFEQAHEGSIFLDEISTLPLDVQGRFLRFLEEGTLRRVGSNKPIQIRTRIIAASNRDLAIQAREGLFLADLYDRLNVLRLSPPPLRKRGDDVPLLLNHYLHDETHTKTKQTNRIHPEAMQFLMEYHWPGNIRELRNLCRRINVFHPTGNVTRSQIEPLLDAGLDEEKASASIPICA